MRIPRLLFVVAFTVLVGSLLLGCASSPTSVEVPDPEPTGHYKFDYKTDFVDKADFTGIKNGIIAVMNKKAGWAEKVEIGEDYSVWIRGVARSTRGSLIHVTYRVELRTPAAITDGDYIDHRSIEFDYDVSEDLETMDNPSAEYIAQQFDRIMRSTVLAESIQVAASNVAVNTSGKYAGLVKLITDYLLTFYPGETEFQYLKVEAIVSGALSYAALKDMILEREK